MIYQNQKLGLYYFNKVMYGYRFIVFGIGPFFLTYYANLRPRLQVYWNKQNIIGES